MTKNNFTQKHPVTLEPLTGTPVEESISQQFFRKVPREVNKSSIVAGVVIGVLVGLLIGWVLYPVEWIPPETIDYLPINTKSVVTNTVADNLAFSEDGAQAFTDMHNLSSDPNILICEVLSNETNTNNRMRLMYLQFQITGRNECQKMN